jgi:transcriptional regulator with XRE-family HTH domain
MRSKPQNDEVARLFGANVRRTRQRAGMSQEKLAERADLHRTEIGLIKRAVTQSYSLASSLAGLAGWICN